MQRIRDIDVEISRLRNETLGTSNDANLSDRREPGDACLLFFKTRWRVDRGLIAMDRVPELKEGSLWITNRVLPPQSGVATPQSGKGKTIEPQPGANTPFHPGALSAMPAGSAIQPSLSSSSLGNPAVSLSSRPQLADGHNGYRNSQGDLERVSERSVGVNDFDKDIVIAVRVRVEDINAWRCGDTYIDRGSRQPRLQPSAWNQRIAAAAVTVSSGVRSHLCAFEIVSSHFDSTLHGGPTARDMISQRLAVQRAVAQCLRVLAILWSNPRQGRDH